MIVPVETGLLRDARVAIHYAEDHKSVPPGRLIDGCTDGLCPLLVEAEYGTSEEDDREIERPSATVLHPDDPSLQDEASDEMLSLEREVGL